MTRRIVGFAALLALSSIGLLWTSRAEDAKDDLLSNEGWTSIFDGKSTEGFVVEGDAKVESGKLLLGSDEAPTTLTWKKRPANVDLRFEFGNAKGTVGQFEIATADEAETSGAGTLAVGGAERLPEWNLLVAKIRCEPDAEGSYSTSQVAASGKEQVFGSTYASVVRSEFSIDTPGDLVVRWTVPKGYRLALRNVYVRERQAP